MNLLDIDQFLKIFEGSPTDQYTLDDFISNYKVVVGEKQHNLKDYMKTKSISREQIQLILENIKQRNKYLKRFYNMSMRVNAKNDHVRGNMDPMTTIFDNNKGVIFKNFIRNLHFWDILQETKSGFENIPTFLNVLFDLYKNNKIDYKILTPSALHYIKNGRMGSVFSSFYFRASILNPYLIYSLNEHLLKGTKIFTPTLGWSSYAKGFMESTQVIEYVGTDVIPQVCKKTEQLLKTQNIKSKIFCKPSEDLFKSKSFLKQYKNHFDVVFFSPPYYKLELYNSDNQSTSRYKDYDDWLKSYWETTIKLCLHVLEKNGKLCYILSGYGSQNTTQKYDLIEDMNTITKKYFEFDEIRPMQNKNVHSTKHRETGEQIILFHKT
jgi:hypothetical protein